MITGKLNLFTEADLDRLESAVLRVLENTGLRVCDQTFLDGLEKLGARVDSSRQLARFPRYLVEALIEERRTTQSGAELQPTEPDADYKTSAGTVIAPFVHDFERRTRRRATRQDLIDIVHWAEVDCTPEYQVGPAVTMGDVDARVEPIEAYAVLLEHSSRPSRAYTTEDDQIPFLLEMARVYFGEPVFPRGIDFMTSPLTFGDRLARYTLAAIRFGVKEFGMGVMPICGGNAPMTIAGNVVISAAELLGCWLAIKSLQPEAVVNGAVCNGIVDMRRGVASFNAPEALLADLGVCELFERRYGGGMVVAAGADYIDARLPGLQAAYERTYRSMAIAAFMGRRFFMGGNGTLDEGKIFSPVQFILEREMGAGMWRLGRGIEVNDDTLAVETIERVGAGEGRSYLDTEHTLRHFRKTWYPQFLSRGIWEGDEIEFQREEKMLRDAHERYKDAISRYVPPAVEEAKLDEIHRIVERARRDLLG